jgi:hypothetical protein
MPAEAPETAEREAGVAGAESAAAGSARAAITATIRNIARSVLSVVPRIPAVKFFRPKASKHGAQTEDRLGNFVIDAAAGSVLFTAYGAASWMLGDATLAPLAGASPLLHSASSDFVSGACGGILHGVIVCPYENWRASRSFVSFRGVGLVARRDALGFGTFFSVYHSIVGHDTLRIDDVPSTAKVLAAGGLSGVSYSLVHALTSEGWRGINNAALRRLAWAFPPNALGFLAYELANQWALTEDG